MSAAPHTPSAQTSAPLHRIEVRPKPGQPDPRGLAVTRKARDLGFALTDTRTAKVYFIEAPLSREQLATVTAALLADPVVESADAGAAPPAWSNGQIVEVHPLPGVMDPAAQSVRDAIKDLVGLDAEVSTGTRYDLAGLDAAAAKSLAEKLLASAVVHQVTQGPWSPQSLPKGHESAFVQRSIPIRDLSDEQLTKMSREAHLFLSLDEMRAIQAEYRRVSREPTDIELETIAQTWSEHCVHKTLKSTIKYRGHDEVTKGSRSHEDAIEWAGRPGHTVHPDGSVTIKNLLKSTVAAATFELIEDGLDWTLSVFKDNSGVIAFDDNFGVCIKVETHNHPSALEPYGGSATGIGGCIRDVIGTGLGAKPIASTDVFCVAEPTGWESSGSLPPNTIHPRRVLTDVVAGIRDYGNRIGIPTVNGTVAFDNRYVGNPLVFAGCVGLIPKHLVHGKVRPGDRIIALGGRTGRDGIHGATFSSAELEHTHADEFSHAVQIGNAIEEKRVLDAILRARDYVGPSSTNAESRMPNAVPLFTAMTDCGAGGFSSAVGEMGKDLGAEVHLDRAPLKYAGLTYTEIWISEAQERMVLAVPPENLAALKQICEEEHVEVADLGHFGTPDAGLHLFYKGTPVGTLSMHFLHEGIPTPTRDATWNPATSLTPAPSEPRPSGRGELEHTSTPIPPQSPKKPTLSMDFSFTSTGKAPPKKTDEFEDPIENDDDSDSEASPSPPLTVGVQSDFDLSELRLSVSSSLLSLLSHPTIASKHWIVRQYDHEVQGNVVAKPLVGSAGRGPGDASVLEPVPGKGRGIAIGCGLATPVGDPALGGDPYQMVLSAIDECVRNITCVGGNPARTAILDNFCWPSCQEPRNLGSLVRAAEGCYDGAKAYRTPFVSGKDSLNNQLRYTDPATGEQRLIEIPPTLLVTGLSIVPNVNKSVTMDAKTPGNMLLLIGRTTDELGASMLQAVLLAGKLAPTEGSGLHPAALPPQTLEQLRWLPMPRVDLTTGPQAARAVHQLIQDGLVHAAHDCSDGGLLVAIAEMLIATTSPTPAGVKSGALSQLLNRNDTPPPMGIEISLDDSSMDVLSLAFAETPSRYIIEIKPEELTRVRTVLRDYGGLFATPLGRLNTSGQLTWHHADVDLNVNDLADAWLRPLDW
jgi:phosphoribosylformylglycinamidine synthase subunit PurSL